ncbi:MAG TPA: MerR family transcriptional regulator [Terriglobales bacterium]|nr:MerR family transcriptional regulator [Terriglobales bacterium]
MRIGELAKRAGVSVQAIRFYERRRLIRTPRRTPAGYRIYTEKDLETVTAIKKMQRFGFKLAEIRRVLQLWILPSDTGAPSPFHDCLGQCLREGLKLGENKLQAMNEQIRSSIQLRDELQEALSRIRARLNAPPPRKAQSDRPKSLGSAAIAAS